MFGKKWHHKHKNDNDELEEESEIDYTEVIVVVSEDYDRLPVSGFINFKVGEFKMSEVTLEVGQSVVATADFIDASGVAVVVANITWNKSVVDFGSVSAGAGQDATVVATAAGTFSISASTTVADGSVVSTAEAVVTVVPVPVVTPVAVSGTISFGPVA